MSLINDALKRAKQAHDQQTPPAMRGASLHAAVPPTAPSAAPTKSTGLPVGVIAGVLLLLLTAVAIFFFLRSAPTPTQKIIARESQLAAEVEKPTADQPQATPIPQIERPTAIPQPVAATHNQTRPGNTTPLPLPVALPTPTVQPPSATPAVPTIAMTNPIQPTTVASNPAPPTPSPVPTFPEVRLQGILFQPGKPAAIINGRTLFIGGRVSEVTVIAITRETATVTWQSQTNVLTLPQ